MVGSRKGPLGSTPTQDWQHKVVQLRHDATGQIPKGLGVGEGPVVLIYYRVWRVVMLVELGN